ncbi:hypothetical protein TNCT_67001 [Trichonephila clavata]|uniref:Uncharacterized protein n=1 Tax=Trichonephila clavata TaxID=2740835 RepID=A0A8X6JAL2_TRICU|nr:hypothetical protein TNCT_430201 [Trichonephila clavata]GFQ80900.1 hypothetical protein TNCT_202321 [Trichonephila clavata]GFQ82828.1 hypothetical protein TNCT_454281 [Trichonephila clavata]GFR17663.1 hypothetical protein TNCT_67001 [Trichonephila clavata]
MWFQLALHSHGPFLGVLVGADSLLYFRIFDLAHLLGKRNGSAFAKRFLHDLVRGRDVLPSFQIFPTQTERAQLVPRDVAYRILYRENVPMAERFSNALDTGWAYVMGPRLFERSYKPSPKLVVVESPHEHTVNVSQWIREFITDVERQREMEMQLLKQYLSPASLKPRVDETKDAILNIQREMTREGQNDETRDETKEAILNIQREMTREGQNDETRDETKEAILNIQREMTREGQNDETRDETMEVSGDETRDETEEASRDETRNETREAPDDETRNETREDSGDEAPNETREASGDETMEETMESPREKFFQMVTESEFKSNFNNKQNSSKVFTRMPQTIHVLRSLNPKVMVVVPDT